MTSTPDLYSRPDVFVGGRWKRSIDGTDHKVINPATGEVLGNATLAGLGDIDDAVAAARASFDAGVWAARPAVERARVLRAAADYLENLGDAAVDLLTRELGCPRWFAARAHVPNPIRHLRYYAGLIEDETTDELRSDGTNRSIVAREPVGVVGAITPWNGPLSAPALKVAPALAAGCSVVLKPPPETPLTAYLLADALTAAGLPEGALSIVPADREVGEQLVRHREVDKVAFTGSTAAGRRIMALCAERIARVTLELGGKSAAIVLDDADLEHFVRSILPMAMMVNGQACIAQTRVVVPRHRQAEVAQALTAAFAALPVGDPFDPQTQIGPLVSGRQRDRVEGYLALAADEGAHVMGGGRPGPDGFFVNPALLTDVANSMRVAQEEIFGPVVALIPYDDVDDAVRIANDSAYGLAGSVWTEDGDAGMDIARRVRTG
ncbi:MAG TPA: aldehyde dehydrogenase, partial [Jatrophihabitans sp.]|nr:aldehyde dehydrogenase [Jatrophihabitans sp.]